MSAAKEIYAEFKRLGVQGAAELDPLSPFERCLMILGSVVSALLV